MGKRPRRSRIDREQFWRNLIRRQQQSGQSIQEFCDSQSVSSPSFYSWRKRLNESSGSPTAQFVPVQVEQDSAPVAPGLIEIRLADGTCVRGTVTLHQRVQPQIQVPARHVRPHVPHLLLAADRHQAKEILDRYWNRFDQLPVAEEAFREHFGLELFGDLTDQERDGLGLLFAKVHDLNGRRDLITDEYVRRTRPFAQALPAPQCRVGSQDQVAAKRKQRASTVLRANSN